MSRLRVLCAMVAAFAIAAATTGIHASGHRRTLVVTMTNDAASNQAKVYDAESHVLLQTLSTHGKGGVGATTVDSFVLHENSLEWRDGTTELALAGGGYPPAGSTAQVGVIGERPLLVTLKTDPDPGTVDIISLDRGRVAGSAPTAVSAPNGTLTPFGFATRASGTEHRR